MNKREEVDKYAKVIWDYMNMKHKLTGADLLWVLGSYDTRVAEYGAQLYLKGFAPVIVFSGGVAHIDDILATNYDGKSEAAVFAEIAIQLGVPKNIIFLEDKSQNTGENILFTYELIESKNLPHKKIILVQKPFMERRTYATFMKQWPDKNNIPDIIVSSPPISFEDYPNEFLDADKIINTMVGDLQHIREYAKSGFQIPQEIPNDVWEAYLKLVEMGYTRHLIKAT